MPRKKKSDAVESATKPETISSIEAMNGDDEDHPTELNRLISEEEYSIGKAEVVNHNHTPTTSSPPSSNSRHNSQTSPPPPTGDDEDLDKISSGEQVENLGKPPNEDEDEVDECSRLTKEEAVVTGQPHSGEYKQIMEMLKDAEAEANEEEENPDYAEAKKRMQYLIKYNPRHPDSELGATDYCCALFQLCAYCLD